MRIALFGYKGYLGTQLSCFFKRNGIVVDGYDITNCDVTDNEFWEQFVPEQFDGIVYFAGLTGTEGSFENSERFMLVNELGLLKLLRKISMLGERAPKVIFPSSRLVFKGSNKPLQEDDPKEARTVYAANKLACEYLLHAYHVRYGLPYAVVRICVPFGNLVSHDYSYGTIGFFKKQAEDSGVITLYGDGAIRRTFTHVKDICERVWGLLKVEDSGVYNIGGSVYSLKDAANSVALNGNAKVTFIPWPEVAKRVESGETYFDSAKIDALLGTSEYVDLVEFLRGEVNL